MTRTSDINGKLDDLRMRHRILDDQILALQADPAINQLAIQRLKKQKLSLKDEISCLQISLLPDIIA